MKIRHRLTLLFTAITALLMALFAGFIYIHAAENREDEFFKRLRQLASTKANLLLDAKVAPETLQLIYKNTRDALFQEEVAIYDTRFNLLYHDAVEIDIVKETPEMITRILEEKQIEFYQDDWQVIGFLFEHGGREYVITAAAYDEYGYTKLFNLRISLLASLAGVISLLMLAGYFFARNALKPVSNIVSQVEEITATNLDLRLKEGNGKDEISELTFTFNNMLDRLEQSFDAQKQFVSNISHEIRTPLAAIIGELEIARSRQRSPDDYEQAIDMALHDAKRLSRLSTSLLDLAKASYDQSEITLKEVRIDEVLLDAARQVQQANPDYKIHISFEPDDQDEVSLSILGNEYLLTVAFANLMENGCKFSSHKEVKVSISFSQHTSMIRFADQGIGIPDHEKDKIFTSFYRGQNKSFAEGSGIGLFLTHKIILLHKGQISVSSSAEGTSFTVRIPLIEV
jgi:signal transduction histidine kinase